MTQYTRTVCLCSSSGKPPAKSTSKISNLQNDMQLFSRMYISCQARDSDMDAFFRHGNHTWPASLESNSTMHQTNKSDLMECLESLIPLPDVATLLHILSKHSTIIHSWYSCLIWDVCSKTQFVRCCLGCLQSHTNTTEPWCWDQLLVANNTYIPVNWKNVLRVDANRCSGF